VVPRRRFGLFRVKRCSAQPVRVLPVREEVLEELPEEMPEAGCAGDWAWKLSAGIALA
jgi:hypothetical protein